LSSARAGVAHLVERDLAKVEVAGSKPVSRSNFTLAGARVRCRGRRSRFEYRPPEAAAALQLHSRRRSSSLSRETLRSITLPSMTRETEV
jgi:hypothetical protein